MPRTGTYNPPSVSKVKVATVNKDVDIKPEDLLEKDWSKSNPILSKPDLSPRVRGLYLCLEEFIKALRTPNKPKERLAGIQISFMDTIEQSLRLDYEQYAEFMGVFIKEINENPDLFSIEKRFLFVEYIPTDDKHRKRVYVFRYYAYIEACIVMAKNITQRHRVGGLVDIASLTNNLNPKAVKNITTYFNSVYSS